MTSCKKNRKEHLKHCNCTYQCKLGDICNTIEMPCPHRGKCCECIKYHKERNELPACYFTEEQEKTYDRSIKFWVEQNMTDKANFVTKINDEEIRG